MSEEIYYAEASDLASRIRSKELSPVEVVQAHLDRIDAANPKLNAVVTPAQDPIGRAREAEAALMRGEIWGPLHGVPFTMKDTLDTEDLRTTRGSMVFADHVPQEDATVVRRLKDAGGILLGKTNTPEFAFWWETGNRVFGRTNNPWDLDRTPGGSSGGEAASIAAGMSPLGVGSDVGGSIRQPAGYCGDVGLKPTHGRVPLTGHLPEVMPRFMHVGPLARTVRDAALALSVLAGPDGRDPYAVPVPLSLPDLDQALPRLRVAWCPEGPFAPVSIEVQATVERAATTLSELGCEIERVSLSTWDDAQSISMSFFLGDGVSMLRPYLEGREDDLTWYFKARMARPKPTFDDYMDSLANTELLRHEVTRLFARYDVLVIPTTPTPAHTHETSELTINGETVEPRNSLRATVSFDLTGSPAVSVPVALSEEGLPIGVQVVGRHFDEATVLHVAAALEAARGEYRRPPLQVD